MKQVTYTDSDGLKYLSLMRDIDTDPAQGILQSPPDVRALDWNVIQVTIHNQLLERGLLTLKDIQIRQNEFNQIVLAAVAKPLARLYQNGESNNG